MRNQLPVRLNTNVDSILAADMEMNMGINFHESLYVCFGFVIEKHTDMARSITMQAGHDSSDILDWNKKLCVAWNPSEVKIFQEAI